MNGYSEIDDDAGSEDPAAPLVILHVDDDPMNLRVVEEILSAFGHVAVKASSGQEALDLLATQAVDVVLMDVHMPGMSGLEAVAKLRGAPGPNQTAPVIALTADVLSRERQDYASLGFDDFVAKPILVSRLMTAIATVSAEHRCSAGARPAARTA